MLDVARDDPLKLRRIISGATGRGLKPGKALGALVIHGVKVTPLVDVSSRNAAPA